MSSKRSSGWKALHCWQYRPLLPSHISTCVQQKSSSASSCLPCGNHRPSRCAVVAHKLPGTSASGWVCRRMIHAMHANGPDYRQPASQLCCARTSRALECMRHTLYRLKYSLSRDKSFPQPATCGERSTYIHFILATSPDVHVCCRYSYVYDYELRAGLHFKHNIRCPHWE